MILGNGMEISNKQDLYSIVAQEHDRKFEEGKRTESILYRYLCAYHERNGRTRDYVTEDVIDTFLKNHGIRRNKRELKRLKAEAEGRAKKRTEKQIHEDEENARKREEAERKRIEAEEAKKKKNIDDIALLDELLKSMGEGAPAKAARATEPGEALRGIEEDTERGVRLMEALYDRHFSSCFIPLRIDPMSGSGVYLIGADYFSEEVQDQISGYPENGDAAFACILYHVLSDLPAFFLEARDMEKKKQLPGEQAEFSSVLETHIKAYPSVEQAMKAFEKAVAAGIFTNLYARHHIEASCGVLERAGGDRWYAENHAYFALRQAAKKAAKQPPVRMQEVRTATGAKRKVNVGAIMQRMKEKM